jgi:hypothetical protein
MTELVVLDAVSEDVGAVKLNKVGGFACFGCKFYATKTTANDQRNAFVSISSYTWDVTWN